MKYDVHIYRMVRIKMAGIEAPSQREAIKIAQEIAPEELNVISSLPQGVECIEDTQEDAYYKVDEVGDEKYKHTRDYPGVFDDEYMEPRKERETKPKDILKALYGIMDKKEVPGKEKFDLIEDLLVNNADRVYTDKEREIIKEPDKKEKNLGNS